MSNESREFPLGTILSAILQRKASPDGLEGLESLFMFMTGSPDMNLTGVLMVADSCAKALRRQQPELAKVTLPDDITDASLNKWLRQMEAEYGATLPVTPIR